MASGGNKKTEGTIHVSRQKRKNGLMDVSPNLAFQVFGNVFSLHSMILLRVHRRFLHDFLFSARCGPATVEPHVFTFEFHRKEYG